MIINTQFKNINFQLMPSVLSQNRLTKKAYKSLYFGENTEKKGPPQSKWPKWVKALLLSGVALTGIGQVIPKQTATLYIQTSPSPAAYPNWKIDLSSHPELVYRPKFHEALAKVIEKHKTHELNNMTNDELLKSLIKELETIEKTVRNNTN